MDIASGIMTAERATAAPRTTIGDLQGMQGAAITELDEVAHVLASKISPVRVVPPEKAAPLPSLAGDYRGDVSPVAAEIIAQTERIQDVTRYLRTVLNEIEF